jgi:hypothetical protein
MPSGEFTPGKLHHAPPVFGELKVAGSGGALEYPKGSAGVWGLVSDSVTDLKELENAGPVTSAGVVAQSNSEYAALFAKSTGSYAIYASSEAATDPVIQATHDGGGPGLIGTGSTGSGVRGMSDSAPGVYGHSVSQAGVVGESDQFDGVWGRSHAGEHAGTTGINVGGGLGVFGWAGIDVNGNTTGVGTAVHGSGSGDATGVEGISDTGNAIHGSSGNGLAGFFEGKVQITGDLIVNGDICLPRGNDFAESFLMGEESIDPGTVVVISDEDTVRTSKMPYDPRVAGVVSGAGAFKPGVILADRAAKRCPLALAGRTFCKVDAGYAPIAVGDLLTSSATPGHAMKAADPARAPGTVVGKALRALDRGTGLVPILVLLQ